MHIISLETSWPLKELKNIAIAVLLLRMRIRNPDSGHAPEKPIHSKQLIYVRKQLTDLQRSSRSGKYSCRSPPRISQD